MSEEKLVLSLKLMTVKIWCVKKLKKYIFGMYLQPRCLYINTVILYMLYIKILFVCAYIQYLFFRKY
jgi:hypothetical protein